MHNLRGGAKKKNPSKSGFDPVRDMLENSTTKLELLSDDSLYGFIVELTVEADQSEYTTIYDQPITNFIMKFVVTTPEKDKLLPIHRRSDKYKQSESVTSFVNEARIQQHIWLQSIQYGRPEICPDVLDVFFFDYQNSKQLIRLLETVTLDDDIRLSMIRYLKNDIFDKSHGVYGIGVMIMPKVTNSLTANSYASQFSMNTTVYSNILAQIVRLFIEIGVIHLDLHSGNILINPDTLYCEIIDFGRIIQLQSEEYQEYQTKYEELNDDVQKSKFMEDTLNYIVEREFRELQLMFPSKKNISSRLEWLTQSIQRSPSIYLSAFQILVHLMPTTSATAASSPQISPPSSNTSRKRSVAKRSISKSSATNKRGKVTIPNISDNYVFDPTKTTVTNMPIINDEVREKKIREMERKRKVREEEEEKENQRIWEENQRKWKEDQLKWNTVENTNTVENSNTEKNPFICKDNADDNSGWGCNIMGGKRKTTQKKLIRKKSFVKRKNKTLRKI